jgi:hypothetical protein
VARALCILEVGRQNNLRYLTPPRLSTLPRLYRDGGNGIGLVDKYSEIKFRDCVHTQYLRLFEQRRL